MITQQPEASHYAWGDSGSERDRLRGQAERLELLTRRFLQDSGIRPGMDVLELGGGPGAVTEILADLVGPSGQVLALERSEAMLDEARQRLGHRRNVDWLLCDIQSLPDLPGAFDALVGRLILTHLSDPVAALTRAAAFLRPGGVAAFQEADFSLCDALLARQHDRLPLVCQVNAWIQHGSRHSTMDRHLGLKLPEVFAAAGFLPPTVQMHTEIYRGVSVPRIRDTVTILRNLLASPGASGLAAHEVEVDTLEQRLLAETRSANAVQARASITSACSRKPAASSPPLPLGERGEG